LQDEPLASVKALERKNAAWAARESLNAKLTGLI
jgi:hypothetical protein